jgi:hypothetical protein
MVLTKEEFLEWKENPSTKYFFKALRNAREVLKEEHIRGCYEEVGKAEGKAQLLQDLIYLNYETLQEIMIEKF